MKKFILALFVLISVLINAAHLNADDQSIMTFAAAPNVLIILDMSGSMNWDPAGNPVSYPNRRIDIARNVIRGILDDNDDGTIDTNDELSLDVRFAYMRFANVLNDLLKNDDGNPLTGRIQVLADFGETEGNIRIGTHYSDVWSKVDDGTDPSGATPLAATLVEAKKYLTMVEQADYGAACRDRFVILITDGADSTACDGNGWEPKLEDEENPPEWLGNGGNPGMYKRRMLTVQRVKELHDNTGIWNHPIKVFVVGFGNMQDHLKTTLNWAAYYGATDNPLTENSGDPGAYNFTTYGDACTTTNTNADPRLYPLSGYAFFAEDASQLKQALRTIVKKEIAGNAYSFTSPAVPAVRLVDQETLYMASLMPKENPWRGDIKAYRLNKDGTLPVDNFGYPLDQNLLWDAGQKLNERAPSDRKIYTVVNGAMEDFKVTNVQDLKDSLGLSLLGAIQLIAHIRGIDTYDLDGDKNFLEDRPWKLGDIFHSNPVVVGSPSPVFEDKGFSGPGGFYENKKSRTKVVIAGANDGMLHAFNGTTGEEEWAFIPGSILKNLQWMSSYKTSQGHYDYVDGTPRVADVWFYSNSTDTTKSADEWRTVLISGLRNGGNTYFALDTTDELKPKYLWEFPKPTDSVTLGKVGESWSEPAIGRVKIEQNGELYERWVAFIGGGFDYKDKVGRAFFVIDIKTGDILWEYSYDNGPFTPSEKKEMKYSLTAPPAAVDTNSDGYVDKVYIGDLGGQMWVFDLPFNATQKKSNSQWSGKRLFKTPNSSGKSQIYFQPAVAFDKKGKLWVYFSTGDRERPQGSSGSSGFYAVKDDGLGGYPRQETDLSDVTTVNTFNQDLSKKGWFIKMGGIFSKPGYIGMEQVLAKPVVFNGVVYFTTYTHLTSDYPCVVQGEGRLYAVEYLSGGGALEVDDAEDLRNDPTRRSEVVGVGILSSPVISIDLQGKATVIAGTSSNQIFSKKIFSPLSTREIIYWREVAGGQ